MSTSSARTTTSRNGFLVLGILGIAILLHLARVTGIWPCDIACQGGAHYQTIIGLSVIWLALALHLIFLGIAWRDWRRGAWSPLLIAALWWQAGVSIFYLWVAWSLSLVCPYCLLIHGANLLLLAVTIPYPAGVSKWRLPLWAVLGVLLTNAVFHHGIVEDTVAVQKPATENIDSALLNHIEKGRTYGRTEVTKTLEIVIDLTCPHCAQKYRPLMEKLKNSIAAGTVKVVVRHLVRPSQRASGPAARLALVAAAMGEHAIAMEILLGSNAEATEVGLKARLAEVIDLTTLERLLQTKAATFDHVLATDQTYIGELGVGPKTPSAALKMDGRVVQRWGGDLPIASILSALGGAL